MRKKKFYIGTREGLKKGFRPLKKLNQVELDVLAFSKSVEARLISNRFHYSGIWIHALTFICIYKALMLIPDR